jgi:alpha-1,3-rhamnosyl/mannosyltransferase
VRIVIDGRAVEDDAPGIGRYVYNLVRALSELGRDDLVFVGGRDGVNTRFDFSALAARGVAVKQSDIPRRLPAEQWALPGVARSLAPCVFHVPFYLAPAGLPKPLAITIHDVIPARFRFRGLRAPIYRLIMGMVGRMASVILTPTVASRSRVARHLRIPERKVRVTPLAADPLFRPPSAESIQRVTREHRLPARYVLHVGAPEIHKNLPRLLAAWSASSDSRRLPALALAGNEGAVASEGSIRSIGRVAEDELPALYGGASLFVFPSLEEGFGMPPLEAMACGTPVACAREPALSEVLGDAAVWFDPESTASIAHTIAGVLDNPARLRELSVRGRQQAARFTWRATAEATRDAYAEAAG